MFAKKELVGGTQLCAEAVRPIASPWLRFRRLFAVQKYNLPWQCGREFGLCVSAVLNAQCPSPPSQCERVFPKCKSLSPFRSCRADAPRLSWKSLSLYDFTVIWRISFQVHMRVSQGRPTKSLPFPTEPNRERERKIWMSLLRLFFLVFCYSFCSKTRFIPSLATLSLSRRVLLVKCQAFSNGDSKFGASEGRRGRETNCLSGGKRRVAMNPCSKKGETEQCVEGERASGIREAINKHLCSVETSIQVSLQTIH